MSDENMKLIMAEFAKANKRLDRIETRLDGIEARLDKLEAENVEINKRLGMLELKMDNLQDNYEKLESDFLALSGDVKGGFYKIKHQIRKLEDQGATIIKIMEYRELIPLS